MDWIGTVNGNIQQNIVAGLKAGLVTVGTQYLPSLDEETFHEILSDPGKELDREGILAFDRGGIPISVCGYYNGEEVINRTTIINIPELLTGGQGSLLWSNAVTAFKNQTRFGEYHLKRLKKFFLQNEPDFIGWISYDAVWKDGDFYYRKVRAGIPYDFAYVMSFLYGMPMDIIGGEIMPQCEPMENFAASLRLYGYPYDEGIEMDLSDFFPAGIGEELHQGPGYFLSCGTGNKINKAWDAVYERIPEHSRLFGLCWRTDGLVESQKRFKELTKEDLV